MFSNYVGVVGKTYSPSANDENETREDDSTTFLYFDKAAPVGLCSTLSFIILLCP